MYLPRPRVLNGTGICKGRTRYYPTQCYLYQSVSVPKGELAAIYTTFPPPHAKRASLHLSAYAGGHKKHSVCSFVVRLALSSISHKHLVAHGESDSSLPVFFQSR